MSVIQPLDNGEKESEAKLSPKERVDIVHALFVYFLRVGVTHKVTASGRRGKLQTSRGDGSSKRSSLSPSCPRFRDAGLGQHE